MWLVILVGALCFAWWVTKPQLWEHESRARRWQGIEARDRARLKAHRESKWHPIRTDKDFPYIPPDDGY